MELNCDSRRDSAIADMQIGHRPAAISLLGGVN
jgi:hypothetical protein